MEHPPEVLSRLVAGVDFGEASIAATTWSARWLVRDPEIVLAHVLRDTNPPGVSPMSGWTHDAGWSPECDAIERRLRELGRDLPAEFVWYEPRIGRAADAILAVASEFRADVIVTGARVGVERRPGAGDSVITHLVRRARVPVIVGAGTVERTPRRILVIGNEMSPDNNALHWARSVGRLHRAHVRTVDLVAERRQQAAVSAGAQVGGTWPRHSGPWRADEALEGDLFDAGHIAAATGEPVLRRSHADLVVIDASAIALGHQSTPARTVAWYAATWATRCPLVFVPEQARRPEA